MFEQPPSPEAEFSAEELELIEALRTPGIENPIAEVAGLRERVTAYIAENQDRLAAEGDPRALLEFDFKTGKMFLAAGYVGKAADTFYAVWEEANQQGEMDLAEQAIETYRGIPVTETAESTDSGEYMGNDPE